MKIQYYLQMIWILSNIINNLIILNIIIIIFDINIIFDFSIYFFSWCQNIRYIIGRRNNISERQDTHLHHIFRIFSSRTEFFTNRHFCTQRLLHTDTSVQKHFYTDMFLYTNILYKKNYTQTLLHADNFTLKCFYT